MAEQPRTPRRGNWATSPHISRFFRSRAAERENANFMGSQSDRRNGTYPGRVFYPSTRTNRESLLSALNVGNYKDSPNNNNNIEHLEEATPSAVETRDLFKELPMGMEEGANGYSFPMNTANSDPKRTLLDFELNWLIPSLAYSEQPNTSISNRNRNAQTMYPNGSRASCSLSHTVTSGVLPEEWANAPEFIPQCSNANVSTIQEEFCANGASSAASNVYAAIEYAHGDLCDICGMLCLHPTDKFKRKMHRRLCQQLHDKNFESTSAAVERSKERTCGICFEVIMEKPVGERRFGILTMCNHCFCLECIRKWRQARSFENKVVKSCPECRITSDFVCPSIYWVDTKEEKDMLIEKYKNALSDKHCKYFKQGRGVCPFGNKCFYLHALPNGTKTDVGPPPRRRRHYRPPEDLDLNEMLQQIILWDIHDDHEHRWLYSFADDLEELASFFSDSDESEWSDYDFF